MKLGILTPTDPVKVLAKAAAKLSVPVPPYPDEPRVERVARVIYEADGNRGPAWNAYAHKSMWRVFARAAISAL